MTKKIVITVKGLEPVTSCVRSQDATKVPVWETIFVFSQIHGPVIYHIISESSSPFRKNSTIFFVTRSFSVCVEQKNEIMLLCSRFTWWTFQHQDLLPLTIDNVFRGGFWINIHQQASLCCSIDKSVKSRQSKYRDFTGSIVEKEVCWDRCLVLCQCPRIV